MSPLHYVKPFPSLVHSYSPVSHPQEDTCKRSFSGFVNRVSNWFLVSIAVVVEIHMAHPAEFIFFTNFTVISSILLATATVPSFVYLFV